MIVFSKENTPIRPTAFYRVENKKTRILLVDDETPILELYSKILQDAGYEVRVASNGRQALRIIRDRVPDLVVLDVVLPDISGIEVCRQIKGDAALRDVFVVLISGKGISTEQTVNGLEIGADEYLSKPMAPGEFLARIRTMVRLVETAAALRASEQHYRRLVAILPDAVAMIDLQFRLTSLNQRAAAMLGYAEPGELLGKSVFDMIHTEDHVRFRADIAALKTGAVGSAEYVFLKRDGRCFPVEMSAALSASPNGESLGLVTVVRDITIRKRAEDSLRESEERFRRSFEDAPIGLALVSLEGRWLRVNRSICEIVGYSESELLAASFQTITHPDDLPSDLNSVRQMLEGKIRDYKTEKRYFHKQGRVVNVHLSASLVRDVDGKPLYFISQVQDITERKRAEEELRRLPQRITEAQEAERLRVARELHDGVNQVIASATMRLRRVQHTLSAQNPTACEILSRCHKLLVQALEENRRIAHNLRPNDLDELGLSAACRNLCEELQARTGLVVKCQFTRFDRLLPPDVDLSLFRMVQEALHNVEKHADAKVVRLRIAILRDTVLLKIEDDGRGFDPTTAKAVRAARRGIGLSSLRGRATALGGTCDLVSSPKQGTVITVRVPCPKGHWAEAERMRERSRLTRLNPTSTQRNGSKR